MSLPFSPLVRRWFEARFGTPTPAQAEGWPAIAVGRRRARRGPDRLRKDARGVPLGDRPAGARRRRGRPPRGPDRRRLRLAAEGARQRHPAEPGGPARRAPGARDGRRERRCPRSAPLVRSGDTPSRERQAMTRRPPHILITTPESLYILLTAEKSRGFLAGARTVIVDEIHAIAADKRGAHLAALARAAGRARGPAPAAHRPLGHAAADRGGGPPPRRHRPGRRDGATRVRASSTSGTAARST